MRKLWGGLPVRWVVVGLLCLGLWGCTPSPPATVVQSAIAQRLAQTQALFEEQSTLATAAPGGSPVGNIQIAHRQRVKVEGQWALQVSGTYRLKGGSLGLAQKRQARPFEIYLQRDAGQDQWFLLAPPVAESGTALRWRALPLPPQG